MTTRDDASTHDFIGDWWLLSREDRATNGGLRIDPILGVDAKGILTYSNGRFAAQIMKRDRTDVAKTNGASIGENNTGAVGGYDACFGTYSVDEESGEVLHRLEGALTAKNVGTEYSQTLTVDGDNLFSQLETTTIEGESIVRTLIWERVT